MTAIINIVPFNVRTKFPTFSASAIVNQHWHPFHHHPHHHHRNHHHYHPVLPFIHEKRQMHHHHHHHKHDHHKVGSETSFWPQDFWFSASVQSLTGGICRLPSLTLPSPSPAPSPSTSTSSSSSKPSWSWSSSGDKATGATVHRVDGARNRNLLRLQLRLCSEPGEGLRTKALQHDRRVTQLHLCFFLASK